MWDPSTPHVPSSNRHLGSAVDQANLAKDEAGYAYHHVFKHPEAMQMLGDVGFGEQVATLLANLTLSAYTIDSTVQRALKLLQEQGSEEARIALVIAKNFAQDEYRKMIDQAEDLINAIYENDPKSREEALQFLKAREHLAPLNTLALRGEIAKHLLERGSYDLR